MLAPGSFVDSLFNDMFSLPFDFGRLTSRASGTMNTDVQEFEDKYRLDLELPGYDREDIKAELKDGYLTIEARHNEEKKEKDKKGKYIRRERYIGQCSRSFYVGRDVKQEDIHAAFDSGILKLEIPKTEAKPTVNENRYIAIQ